MKQATKDKRAATIAAKKKQKEEGISTPITKKDKSHNFSALSPNTEHIIEVSSEDEQDDDDDDEDENEDGASDLDLSSDKDNANNGDSDSSSDVDLTSGSSLLQTYAESTKKKTTATRKRAGTIPITHKKTSAAASAKNNKAVKTRAANTAKTAAKTTGKGKGRGKKNNK
jgi:hypothetical protein